MRRDHLRLGRLMRGLAALGIVAGAMVASAAPVGAAGLVGKQAPDYSARILDSEDELSLLDLRGKAVLFNVWATWCEPCREEMPAFQKLQDRYLDEGLRVVAVSIDEGRGDGGVSRFVEKAGYTYDILRDPSNRVGKRFRVLGPPETFLVDRAGQIAYHWRGVMDPALPANQARIRGALGLETARGGTLGTDAASAAGALAVGGLLVAFGAGLISVLSPCVLPLIPSYASVITGVTVGRQRAREATAPAMVTVGAPEDRRVGLDFSGPAAPGLDTSGPAAPGLDTSGPAAPGLDTSGPAAPGLPPVPGPTDRGVALRAGLSFVGGFTAVFMALGVLVNAAGAALADNRIWLTRVGGVILVIMGLHLLGVFTLRAAEKESRLLNFSGRKGYVGAFLVGVAFAAGWSPCIGPVLSGILTMAASGGSTLQAAILLLAYSAGLAIPFLLAALALDRFLVWSARLRKSWLPVAERVSGALVLGVGILLLTGIFSQMAAWLA